MLVDANPETLVRFIHGTKNSLRLVQCAESQFMVMHLDISVSLNEKYLSVGPQVVDLVLFIFIIFLNPNTLLKNLRGPLDEVTCLLKLENL